MQLRTKVVGAAGIAAIVAAGGFAFTAGNSMPAKSTAGYGSVSVENGTVNNLVYTFTTDGTEINKATFDVGAQTDAPTVKAGFGTSDLVPCTATGAWTDTGGAVPYSHTGVFCDFNGVSTNDAQAFHVLIANGTPGA